MLQNRQVHTSQTDQRSANDTNFQTTNSLRDRTKKKKRSMLGDPKFSKIKSHDVHINPKANRQANQSMRYLTLYLIYLI